MGKWVVLADQEPKREEIYLVFSPKFGYQTLVWENKRMHRQDWAEVIYWMAFEKVPHDQAI